MEPAPEKRPRSPARRTRPVDGVPALLLGVALAVPGCIVIPVPSVTPDYRAGIIDDKTLESLIGLDQNEVHARVGYPDYSGMRGDFYVMVYEGETRHSTEVYAFVSGGYSGGGGKIDEGTSRTLHCQVLELDVERVVEDYDVMVRPAVGISARHDSGYVMEPASDCAKVVWGGSVEVGTLPGQVEATKTIMRQREEHRTPP